MRKDLDTQIQEAQRTPSRTNEKSSTQRRVVLKLSEVKVKENSEGSKRKAACSSKGASRVSEGFSGKTSQARREWDDVLKVLKEENQRPRYCIYQNRPS